MKPGQTARIADERNQKPGAERQQGDPPRRRRRGSLAAAVQRGLESLEPRRLMAADEPFINEFMADNQGNQANSLRDNLFNAYPDWIEIYNPSGSTVSLANWHLTDNKNNPTKWTFPAGTSVSGGGFLTVFADNRASNGTTIINSKDSAGKLHATFSLNQDGEYLALTRPDGSVVNAFDEFPPQLGDVSYGLGPGITSPTTILASGASSRTLIPTSGALGTTWKEKDFDDSTWIDGHTGVGFETQPTVSQFRTRMIDTSSGSINNISQATTLLGGTTAGFTVASDVIANSNQINYGDGGDFLSGDNALPNGVGGAGTATLAGREQYAMRTTANVTIPAGTWTFAVGSDAGFRMTIAGVTFTNRSNEDYTSVPGGVQADTLVFGGQRASGRTTGTITLAAPLTTTLQLDYFETTGADYLELSAASGAPAFSTQAFSLVQNGIAPPGGAAAFAIASQKAPVFAPLIGTDIPQMQALNKSVYVRVPFTVDTLELLTSMTLRMKYNDGYVAYLNGTEVSRKLAPATPTWNSAATNTHNDALAVLFEDVNLSAFTNLLVEGTNVLAIQGLNFITSNNNLLILPQIDLGYAVPPGLRYMLPSSPNTANTAGSLGVAKDTNFSVDRGYYDDPFDVVVSTKQQNATIYYTLNGRSPLNGDLSLSPSALKYTGPIHISTTSTLRAITTAPGYTPSEVDTMTYLFTQDVLHQADTPNVAGFPAQWVDIANTITSYGPGNIAKYSMAQEVVNDPLYKDEIASDLKSLPVMSIVMNPDDLFGNGAAGTNGIKGIYSNPNSADTGASTTTVWERPTSVEYFFPDGSRDGFHVDTGIQIQGGASRAPSNQPKHGFRLVFKNKYGVSKLHYKLFDDSDVMDFDQLILKSQFNKTWSAGGDGRAQFTVDQFASDTQLDMGRLSKHGNYAQLYLNGVYWGLYNIMERPTSSFVAEHLGGDAGDWDVINDASQLLDGSKTTWDAMFTKARAGLASPAAYEDFKKYLDIPNFIDYFLMNFYIGNGDWDSHNFFAARRSRTGGLTGPATDQFGGFQFFSFDAEFGLSGNGDSQVNVGAPASPGGAIPVTGRPSELYQQLKLNADFRTAFADAVHKHMFNGGALSPNVARARFLAEDAKVFSGVVAESARWGNYTRDYYVKDPRVNGNTTFLGTRNGTWMTERNRLTGMPGGTGNTTVDNSYFGSDTSAQSRTKTVIAQIAAAGLYPTLAAAELNKFGGVVASGFTATLAVPNNPAGILIYYTLDGSDPRQSGGAVSPTAIQYAAGGFQITSSKRVMARAYDPNTATWSALTDATFTVGAAPRLRITEMMYHPQSPAVTTYEADDYEFLELQNTGATAIDPSGFVFTNGIDYTFPAGSAAIPAGGRVVLVRNPLAFVERYGGQVPIAGTYTGELGNDGEQIRLTTGLGQVVENVTYKDSWFDQTDGAGFALVAVNPDAADGVLSTKDGWRSGQPTNGNPGGADAGFANDSIVINELVANSSTGQNWVELKNPTNAAIDISGWFLSNDPLTRMKYAFPAGTVIAAHGLLTVPQPGGFGAGFNLSGAGGSLYLTSSDGQGGLGGYRDATDYGASDADASIGRYVKSTGGSDFVIMSAATPGAENAYPKVGPVVINEVMYNPFGTDREFVEVRNITDAPVSVAGWTFAEGVNFTFPGGATIPGNGYALVVSIDPALYRSTYNVPSDVQIFGPYTGALDNSGEKIILSRPGVAAGGVTPLITVDRVNYDNETPWPSLPDGTGPSAGRINASRYGNDPANWKADTTHGSGGTANALAPVFFAGSLGYPNVPRVSVKFNRGMAVSNNVASLTLFNRTTSQTVSGTFPFTYDPATQVVTWQLPATLADGDYRATLVSAALTDGLGRPLDGNSDGNGGDNGTFDFFHFNGDANHDRTVDFNDLVSLAQNYNTPSGMTFGQGDFNFDGAVDFNDLVVLAQHYNTTLAAPPAGGEAPAAAPAVLSVEDATAMASSWGFAPPVVTPPVVAPPKSPPPPPPAPKPVVKPPTPVVKPAPKPAAKPVTVVLAPTAGGVKAVATTGKGVATTPAKVVATLPKGTAAPAPKVSVMPPPPPPPVVTFGTKKIKDDLLK